MMTTDNHATAAPEQATPRYDKIKRAFAQGKLDASAMREQLTNSLQESERENADLRRQLAENANATRIGNEWIANSSLEIWFPITAEELQRLKDRAERAEAKARDETAIVNRIWDQLGNPSYKELNGRYIYDLIDELKAEARRNAGTVPHQPDDMPLKCTAEGGGINMSVGPAVLRFAAENHDEFFDPDKNEYSLRVTDITAFAREVARAMNDEDEDGSTRLSRALDSAIAYAAEQGCEGLEL